MKLNGQKGFTLLELSIVMLIVGIGFSAGILGTARYIKGLKIKETQNKIEFIENALSDYVQTHYRLPCPADPGATAAEAGREGNNGNCLQTNSSANMYWQTEGIVPWKEIGIPEDMVIDGWHRYITYKPAPNLTADMRSAEMQDTANATTLDVNDACRTPMWFDAAGNHVNRAKALFCCDSQPTASYLAKIGQPTTLPANWRKSGVTTTNIAQGVTASPTASLADGTQVVATSNWTAPATDTNLNGQFTIPHYLDGPDVPLLRATGLAVTLISHGGNGNLSFLPNQAKTNRIGSTIDPATGVASNTIVSVEKKNSWPPQMFAGVMGHPKIFDGTFDLLGNLSTASDDIVSFLRTDQIFAKAGDGSCEYPPAAIATTYTCEPQNFDPVNSMKDPLTGMNISIPDVYGLQMSLTGQKYQLKTAFTQKMNESGYTNSLGFYTIKKDGTIGDVSIVETGIDNSALNNQSQKALQSPAPQIDSDDILGVGVFIVANGKNNNDYSRMNFVTNGQSNLHFVSGYGTGSEQDANIQRIEAPTLVYKDPNTGVETRIHGAGDSEAYHMYSNLNAGQVNRTMRDEYVCHYPGEMVGPSRSIPCSKASATQDPGVDPNDPTQLSVGFEDLQQVICYETASGCIPDAPVADRLLDQSGGYLAEIGDSDFDDVAFNFRMNACPEGN